MNIASILLIFIVSQVPYVIADGSSLSDEQSQAQLLLLDARVSRGENQALLDVAKLDQSVAIPYLSRLVTDYHTNPTRSDLAKDALATIRGHGEYLRKSVADRLYDKAYKITVYRVLTRLKTKEAVKALAYFLINDDTPAVDEEDVSIGSGRKMAAMALGEMYLPNSPTDVHPHAYGGSEIAQWQQWWHQHQAEY